MQNSLTISYVFNYVLFCSASFFNSLFVFNCTSLGAAVSALRALLSSHTYRCPCNCLYLFYDKYMMMMMMKHHTQNTARVVQKCLVWSVAITSVWSPADKVGGSQYICPTSHWIQHCTLGDRKCNISMYICKAYFDIWNLDPFRNERGRRSERHLRLTVALHTCA